MKKLKLGNLPVHVIIITLCVIWIVPALGLLVTSVRDVRDANESGWWMIFAKRPGGAEFDEYCAACHGSDGMWRRPPHPSLRPRPVRSAQAPVGLPRKADTRSSWAFRSGVRSPPGSS